MKIKVSDEFVAEALECRYNECRDNLGLGDEITDVFFPHLVDMVLDGGDINKTLAEVIDNFIVNSDMGYLVDYLNDDESESDCLDRLEPLSIETCDGKTVIWIQ